MEPHEHTTSAVRKHFTTLRERRAALLRRAGKAETAGESRAWALLEKLAAAYPHEFLSGKLTMGHISSAREDWPTIDLDLLAPTQHGCIIITDIAFLSDLDTTIAEFADAQMIEKLEGYLRAAGWPVDLSGLTS